MGLIYMIGRRDAENLFKIGSTRSKSATGRLKTLQTGNDCELYIYKEFKTKNPFKVEKLLHNHFMAKREINEWFRLTDDDVKNMQETFNTFDNAVNSLEDNTYLNRKLF